MAVGTSPAESGVSRGGSGGGHGAGCAGQMREGSRPRSLLAFRGSGAAATDTDRSAGRRSPFHARAARAERGGAGRPRAGVEAELSAGAERGGARPGPAQHCAQPAVPLTAPRPLRARFSAARGCRNREEKQMNRGKAGNCYIVHFKGRMDFMLRGKRKPIH